MSAVSLTIFPKGSYVFRSVYHDCYSTHLKFAVTAAFIPSTVAQINYEIYNHVYFGAMWADLFYTHPALYVALYILLDGLFAGLIALIGYAFSFYITNQFAAAAFPLLLFGESTIFPAY